MSYHKFRLKNVHVQLSYGWHKRQLQSEIYFTLGEIVKPCVQLSILQYVTFPKTHNVLSLDARLCIQAAITHNDTDSCKLIG